MKNNYLTLNLNTIMVSILIILFISGCENNNSKDQTVVYLTLGDMSYVADDSLYGNQKLDVPEITQGVMDNGGELAFIDRPATDKRPQRWSQLPQLTLAWDNPTYMYLSHGLGFVRLSYQSAQTIKDAIEYTKENLNYSPLTSIKDGIPSFVDWYKGYYKK